LARLSRHALEVVRGAAVFKKGDEGMLEIRGVKKRGMAEG
jgi:hypothetical protein